MSIDALQAKIRAKKNPVAVALDLQRELIPQAILRRAMDENGETLRGLAEAYFAFGVAVLDALADVVPAVKLQTGFFEALGPDGLSVMARLCAHAKSLDYYVLVETMRADAEPVAALLAKTFFGEFAVDGRTPGLYGADAVSLSGFLGSDGIKPYLPYCKEGKNLFVLAKTANKSSREVQDLISGDRVVYTVMADLAMRWGGELMGKGGYAELGLTVGATHPEVLRQLRGRYDRLFFLVTGFGEQGSTVRDVVAAFDKFGHGALLSAGDFLLGAWKKQGENGDFAQAVRAAAIKLRTDLAVHVAVM